ncbi:protein SPATA31F1 [Ctenodactylus gundi]
MLSPIFVLWDIGCPLYTYGSIFFIILIIWQVKRSYHGLRYEHTRSCCRRHQKIRQKARDAASRARRRSQEEAKKPWELLSVMKSQGWISQEESVRELLCADPSCQTCNAVALEIQQLLAGENNQISPDLAGTSQGSSCLQKMSMSTVSFEKSVELHPQHSRDLSLASATSTLSQLMGHKNLTQEVAQTTNAINIQEHWADYLQLEQKFQPADMPVVQENTASPRLEEPVAQLNEQKTVQNSPGLTQENKSKVSLLPLNPETANLTHSMAFHVDSVLPAHLPFLKPEVLWLLEGHIKKWMHFQKWGLPRRVENSLRQFIPDQTLFGRPGKKHHLFSRLNSTSQVTTDTAEPISQQSWGACTGREPTQAIWVSEWPIIHAGQRHYSKQIKNCNTLPLSSPLLEVQNSLYPLPGGQATGSGNNLQQKCSQLFCGLPFLHSESLAATCLSSQGFSKNKNMPKSHLKDSLLFKDFPFSPLLPKTQPATTLPSTLPSPNCDSATEHQAQVSAPLLTPAECETLEWHLLQKQLQHQWGPPAIFQRSCHAQSPMQLELCGKIQSPETVKTSWPGQPAPVLTRELLFFPGQARRLLEFHLQKQLIHLRWGLPPKIQESIQLLLSSADQQTLSWNSVTLSNVSTSQPKALEANGTTDPFLPTVAQVSIPMPYLFAQAKAILHGHIDSKCGQIHQGKFPCHVHSSWERRIPEGLAVTPFSCILQGQPPEPEAASHPGLHHKITPWMPEALGQQPQSSPGAPTEHRKLTPALPQGAIEKLETTLRHKYLAFLSGLPALYYMALSKAMAPATTSHSVTTEMVPGPAETPKEPLTPMISLEDPCIRLESCFQKDNVAWTDITGEFQPEMQVEGKLQVMALESQKHPASPSSFKTRILAQLNFHLRKKVIEIKLGVPVRLREPKEPTTDISENKFFSRASPGSLSSQGSTVDLLVPPDSSPAPDSEGVHRKEQLATELSSQAVSRGFIHRASKISHFSGDTNETQVLCVQVGASVNSPSLEESWSAKPHAQGQGKDSAHVPTLAEKREDTGKPKAAGDLGEGDAGLGLSLPSEERLPDEDQRPDRVLQNRKPQGAWGWSHGFHLVDLHRHSSQCHSQLKLPDSPPQVPEGNECKRDTQDSQSKLSAVLEPARFPESAHPAVSQASQGQPFLGQPIQCKPLQGQTLQGSFLQGQVMPVPSHTKTRLPESGSRNKMKSFLCSSSAMPKGKGRVEAAVSTPEKVAKTREENAEKSLTPAESPIQRTETKKPTGHTKAQSLPAVKPVVLSSLCGPHSPDQKLRLRSRQQGSASVLGRPRHCPRHCPRVVLSPNQETHSSSHPSSKKHCLAQKEHFRAMKKSVWAPRPLYSLQSPTTLYLH